jgi:Domain of unknown function (DUF1844)
VSGEGSVSFVQCRVAQPFLTVCILRKAHRQECLCYLKPFAAAGVLVRVCGAMINCVFIIAAAGGCLRGISLAESKQDESFKVVDRRLFTPEGEFRKEVAEQQDREREAAPAASVAKAVAAPAPAPPPDSAGANAATEKAVVPTAPLDAIASEDAPKRAPAFENLVRSLGQNAAMLLGGYADPRTGQPMLDLEGAREMIDMLDVLREKTRGNLAAEEDTLLLDVLGNLKLAFMEMAKAAAQHEKAQTRP